MKARENKSTTAILTGLIPTSSKASTVKFQQMLQMMETLKPKFKAPANISDKGLFASFTVDHETGKQLCGLQGNALKDFGIKSCTPYLSDNWRNVEYKIIINDLDAYKAWYCKDSVVIDEILKRDAANPEQDNLLSCIANVYRNNINFSADETPFNNETDDEAYFAAQERYLNTHFPIRSVDINKEIEQPSPKRQRIMR